VAAPTTSLPEAIGGARNWDYRYTWIRDAAFSIYALLRLGFTEEAAAFIDWLTPRFQETRPGTSDHLQVVYDIHGGFDLKEQVLVHTWRAIAARLRCGSATTPPTSCSSTSTAS
jgi:GH15 family glucan-1,4-alpha-glucosidase